jgi:hypothetical protein
MVLRAINFSDSLHVIAMYSDFNSRICSSLLQMIREGCWKLWVRMRKSYGTAIKYEIMKVWKYRIYCMGSWLMRLSSEVDNRKEQDQEGGEKAMQWMHTSMYLPDLRNTFDKMKRLRWRSLLEERIRANHFSLYALQLVYAICSFSFSFSA